MILALFALTLGLLALFLRGGSLHIVLMVSELPQEVGTALSKFGMQSVGLR